MVIRPKAIRRFTVSPGSSEDVFTQMVAGCEALWRETHFESMIQRTIKLLQANFRIPIFVLMRLQGRGDQFTTEIMPLRIKQAEEIEPQLLKDVTQHFKAIDMQAAEYGNGIHRLTIERKSINFALLGDIQHEWYALLWKDPPPILADDPLESLDPSLNYSAELAFDFMIKQLQTTCRWFSRFTETQTLLHLDDLTGLYNHRYLEQAIDREIKRSQRYNSPFCLLFIDLDEFKPINDKHGHLAGSQVLREVAQILKATVRDVDLVFRFGGDEFVVLLIESDPMSGYKTAQRIRERIQYTGFVVAPGVSAHVTASIGVAAYPEHCQEKERLLGLADECMYESKRNGKNKVVLVGHLPNQTTAPQPEPASEETVKDRWDNH